MKKDHLRSIRLTEWQVKKCEEYAFRMRKDYGVNVTVSDIIRMLIDQCNLNYGEAFQLFSQYMD